jgi:hypothetical protein
MTFQLAPEEPDAGPWRAERLAVIAPAIARRPADPAAARRPVILAIDGRSSSGKTALAARISAVVAGSAVVPTDDLAWRHSRFGWADLLIQGILVPARRGEAVTFRPPRWAEHGREGAISVPAGCLLLVIEGVGAGRREVAGLIDALVWVQSDEAETRRRSLARIGAPGGPRSATALREWMAEEGPFIAGERPWERADLIICGTPDISYDPATEIVIGSGLGPRS